MADLLANPFARHHLTKPITLGTPRSGGRLLRPDRQEQDWRSVRVLGFKSYIVYYWVDPETVHIVRVAHGSRDLESLLRSR